MDRFTTSLNNCFFLNICIQIINGNKISWSRAECALNSKVFTERYSTHRNNCKLRGSELIVTIKKFASSSSVAIEFDSKTSECFYCLLNMTKKIVDSLLANT